MAKQLKPIGDRVLVEAVEEENSNKTEIFIPDTAKEKPTEAIVRALGTGKTDDAGKKIPFEVKVGDRVLTSKYGGTEVKLDKREFRILSSDDILGVIN
jgi:chaperonin GroES